MSLKKIEDGIEPETLAQLRAAQVVPGRPLIAVDVDEVLVVFVDHLSRYIRTLGFEMHLVRYQLEGSIFPIGSRDPIPFEDCISLIRDFFEHEVERQEVIPDGPEVLRALSNESQIVLLTNVPRHATEGRRRNMDANGIPYPLVANQGGKGRAMAWLATKADAPCAFLDDSVKQIESVAKHAPEVLRVHFAWADFIDRFYPTCAFATARVRGWREAEKKLRAGLGLNREAKGAPGP